MTDRNTRPRFLDNFTSPYKARALWTDGVPPGAEGFPGEGPEQVGARADRVLHDLTPALESGDVPKS